MVWRLSNKPEEWEKGTLIFVWVLYVCGPSFLHIRHIVGTWNPENDNGMESKHSFRAETSVDASCDFREHQRSCGSYKKNKKKTIVCWLL